MDTVTMGSRKDALRGDLLSAHTAFHAALDIFSDEELRKPSTNPAWTNKQILFHIALGFFLLPILIPLLRLLARLPPSYSRCFAQVLNASTGLFDWLNAFAPRLGGTLFSRRTLGTTFDKVHGRILRQVDSISERDLALGMYYPDRWEPLFHEYMTLEDLLRYPTTHLRFHLEHLAS